MGDMQGDYNAMAKADQIIRSRQDEAQRKSRTVLDDFVQLLSTNGVAGLPIYSESSELFPEKTFAGFTTRKCRKCERVSTLTFIGNGYVVDESDMTTSNYFYVQGLGIINGYISDLARLKINTSSSFVVTVGGLSPISRDDTFAYVSRWRGPSDTSLFGWDSEARRRSLLIRARQYIELKRAY